MQDPPPSVLDDEEAVQQVERHRRRRKEVEGGDTLAMVLEEGKPTLARVPSTMNSSKIPACDQTPVLDPYRVFADHTYRVITAASRISGPRR